MNYEQLNTESVLEHIKKIPTVKSFFNCNKLNAKEIGDGNLNYVFVVSNENRDKQLVVKQAVPYLRYFGEAYPLSRDRMNYEIDSMMLYGDIIGEHIPKIYHSDKSMSLIIMQYLNEHKILRKGLIYAEYFPNFDEHISTFLAETLFRTSSLYLQGPEKHKLIEKFINNTELCKVTENFVFTYRFMNHETTRVIPELQKEADDLWNDAEFKENVLDLKYCFMNKTESLIHGDLHTGSIMVNENDTYVIDSEFAFFGPMGFDIGLLFGNFVIAWTSHFGRTKNKEYQDWLLSTARAILEKFSIKFTSLWKYNENSALIEKDFVSKSVFEEYQNSFIINIIQESIGFAGCEMARRIFSAGGVEDTQGIQDKDSRILVEKKVLNIAKQFVKNYRKILKIDDIFSFIK